MHLTPEQIKQFEQALNGPAPTYDPNWAITRQLLQVVVVQAKEMMSLQARVDALTDSNTAAQGGLVTALRKAAGGQAAKTKLSPMEVQSAMQNLNQAIESYKKGEQVAKFAGQVLKFAAFLL